MALLKEVTRNRARGMRREPTLAERKLWRILRGGQLGGAKFRRQHPLEPYILDFVCVEAKLAIELDGSQHWDSPHDARRDAFLREKGWRVVRVWNADLMESPDGVADMILKQLRDGGH